MKLLDDLNNESLADRTAGEVLETAPLIMRAVREVMRSQRTPDITIPQFRTLGFLHRYEGSSLSSVAEHIGLRAPTMSKTIDALVARGLVIRHTHVEDRRRVTLSLSDSGRSLWREARAGTSAFVTEKLTGLTDEELSLICGALELLRPLFSTGDGNDRKDTR